ncbi:MAG: hypothetical protein ACI8RZ_004612 [Myxococcota bacterium]|jgi:hypothetical protein
MLILLTLLSCGRETVVNGVFTGEVLLAHCESYRRIAVSGSVVMSLEDAAGLECLVSVSDDLTLYGTGGEAAPDLLPRLEQVGGDLTIRNALLFPELTGLNRLEQVGGALSLTSLSALTRVDAFGGLTEVGGDLTLSSLPLLSEARALPVTRVGGSVLIYGTLLEDLGLLSSLTSLQSLGIQENSRLTDLSGLEALSSLNNTGEADDIELYIIDNAWLDDISALSGMDWTNADVYIGSSAALDDLSAFSGTTAMGQVRLEPRGYTSLSGLESLETAAELRIAGFPGLTALDGLSALREVSGQLVLFDNTLLSDLGGLASSLERVGDLYIAGNPQLGCDEINTLLSEIEVTSEVDIGDCDADTDKDTDKDTGEDADTG